jgi:ABC-type glycerol-3-phosphate transport system permease component
MMVEHRPALTVITHAVLILGAVVLAFPIYVTFIASTHTIEAITKSFPCCPGAISSKTTCAPSPWGPGTSVQRSAP